MDHTPAWVHAGRLLLVGGAVAFAGAGTAVPTGSTDWALAGSILVAAIVQAEITRRTHTGREEPHPSTAVVSAWLPAAAISVHLTLAIALALVLCLYRCLRGKLGAGDLFDLFAIAACSVIAANFAAQAILSPVLAIAASTAAYLVVSYAAGFLRYGPVFFGRVADIGLDVALLTTGAIIGALAPGGFLIVFVAIPVVVMLHGAAFSRQLEDEASVDQKTGLATAAYWQANADRTFAEAAQDRRPIGVLMVDLDHFKRLNDTYGHRAGDDVLAAVGACLRSQLRHSDLAGRFGGEEFTVLLPDADVIDTMTAAERIRTTISTLRVPTVDNHGRHTVITEVTASIGAAIHPHHGATADECLRIADSRVYQAKQHGRNTVVGTETS